MARRMIVRPNQSRDRNQQAEPFEVFTRPQRSTPARVTGLLLRLRAEITTAVVLLVAWVWLAHRIPTGGVAVTVGSLALVVVLVPHSRRYVTRRGWAVMTRHRLRAVFVERRVMNYTGNLPLIVWARPTPVGERVWLVLRAGIDVVDVERNLDYIASGCWARTARAETGRTTAALVVVDVIRRDPLSSGLPVVSDLPRLHAVPVLEGA
jgi:hypothetical protein